MEQQTLEASSSPSPNAWISTYLAEPSPILLHSSTPNAWISSFLTPSSTLSPLSSSTSLESKPRSQIEALPPSSTPPRASISSSTAQPTELKIVLDPASRHPVFFTDRLKRAPNGVLVDIGSPICEGYVFEEREGRKMRMKERGEVECRL